MTAGTEDAEEQGLIEHAVLATILDLHPQRLSVDELTRRVDRSRDLAGGVVRESVIELERSGVVRVIDDLVEPTHAAVRANEILSRS